jgi:hypothetical protein
MTEQDIYNFSKSIKFLEDKVRNLKNKHIYRYSKLVDTSSRGFECSYAKMTIRMLPEEHDDFLQAISEIETISSLIKEKYENEFVNEEKEK